MNESRRRINDRLERASEYRVRAYSSKTQEGATDGRTAQTRHRHHPNEEALYSIFSRPNLRYPLTYSYSCRYPATLDLITWHLL